MILRLYIKDWRKLMFLVLSIFNEYVLSGFEIYMRLKFGLC